ncbi:MAG: V-type ATP synthase subunit F [Clostridia bacterium]|nr:V-type ATP synthase subunit F [Clostridia bacterium]
MKFFLISDNVDTQVGLRLAGVKGVVVHKKEEVENALKSVLEKPDVAIVLITEKLVNLCPDLIYDIKLNRKQPLLVQIMDRHGSTNSKDAITRYVTDAIGVKF